MPGNDDYWGDDHDPYTDQRTGILKNIPGFDSAEELEKFEAMVYQANFFDACECIAGLKQFDLAAWEDVHRICFSDVYEWAGEIRTVRIKKGHTVFAYPENIKSEAAKLLGALNKDLENGALDLAKAAEFYAELNVVHPFREGNGRTQRVIFAEVFRRIGYEVDYTKLTQGELIAALVDAYNGDYAPITRLFERIVV